MTSRQHLRSSTRIPGCIATAIRDQDARVPGLLFSAMLVPDRPKDREEPDAPADAPTPWCRRYHPGARGLGHSRFPTRGLGRVSKSQT
jgi:hypothetical protein